ncbi:hypothetical protein [Gallaecimonas sp. GXIMD4217]|uniref:hypothetical protein n=1 Tax=Gallaecimonas sp. GXIMD4217 TaxID=3131927 RepID=UPI00311AD273
MLRALLLFFSLLLTACSFAPGEGELAEMLDRHYERQLGPGVVLVRNLEKVNGRELGSDRYLVDVKYDLVFLKSFDELASETEGQAEQGRWLSAISGGLNLWQLSLQFGQFQRGDVRHLDERHELLKTEQGWDLASAWEDQEP